jgi:hypothetical protein
MTQDEIIMCADASGISLYGMGKDRVKFVQYLEAFANLITKYERDACADIAENWNSNGFPRTGVANEIRARGQA